MIVKLGPPEPDNTRKAWVAGVLTSLLGGLLLGLFCVVCVRREVADPWYFWLLLAPSGLWIGLPVGLWVWGQRKAAVCVGAVFGAFASAWALCWLLLLAWMTADLEKQEEFEKISAPTGLVRSVPGVSLSNKQ